MVKTLIGNLLRIILIYLSFLALSLSSFAQPIKTAKDGRLVFQVKDFGAVGDGKTDDGPALRKLFEKASAINRPAKIEFEKK